MSQIIWLVRHANRLDFVYPEWFNTAVRRYDPPLSEDGMIQAQQLTDSLHSEKIDHIFASPFLRTIQTAYPLGKKLNLPIKLEAGLGEWHNGDWMDEKPETKPFSELISLYPLIDSNYRSQIVPQYPETLNDVKQRTQAIINLLIQQFNGNILIIAHSVSIIGMAEALLNNNQPMKNPPLCSVTKIVKKNEQWILS